MTESEYNYSRYRLWRRVAAISLSINGWVLGMAIGLLIMRL
jgi:hypothetical protein